MIKKLLFNKLNLIQGSAGNNCNLSTLKKRQGKPKHTSFFLSSDMGKREKQFHIAIKLQPAAAGYG